MRLARAICSDVSLYNEEKIVRGIEHDNFQNRSREIPHHQIAHQESNKKRDCAAGTTAQQIEEAERRCRIPWCDVEAVQWIDEAGPVEGHVGRTKRDRPCPT